MVMEAGAHLPTERARAADHGGVIAGSGCPRLWGQERTCPRDGFQWGKCLHVRPERMRAKASDGGRPTHPWLWGFGARSGG